MKLIVLILLALVCAPAFASDTNPCNVSGKPNYLYNDLINQSNLYRCAPTLSSVTVRVNSAGAVVWWYCPISETRSVANWAAATHGWIAEHALQADLYAALAGPDPLASLNALARTNVDKPLADPTIASIWCPFVQEMADATPGGWYHPAMVTSGRVAYDSANNALSGFVGLINTGLACDCTSKIHVGASTYCTFAGAAKPSIVAQCKPSP